MADARRLGRRTRKGVQVQLLSPALNLYFFPIIKGDGFLTGKGLSERDNTIK